MATFITFLSTFFALLAFAANSILCRMALGGNVIDASSFTVIRLFSGVMILLVISKSGISSLRNHSQGSWAAAVMLFLYAMTFSFAYLSLNAGTGALILFGAVQLTMIGVSFLKGMRLHVLEWFGVGMAFLGFIHLMLPSVTTPSFHGFILMAIAGVTWGIYTLLGKESANPLADTTMNFVRTLPLVGMVTIWAVSNGHLSAEGVGLAFLSGAVASGMGYTVWFMALKGLSTTEAGVVQLSVPVIAAMGGVFFLDESLTLRLVMAGSLILGGILTVIVGRYYARST